MFFLSLICPKCSCTAGVKNWSTVSFLAFRLARSTSIYGMGECSYKVVVQTLYNTFLEIGHPSPLTIYTILCLKSVCLATFAQCSSQFWLNRVGRCLKLIASTRGTFCHEFASQFGLDFLYAKKPQTIVARILRSALRR